MVASENRSDRTLFLALALAALSLATLVLPGKSLRSRRAHHPMPPTRVAAAREARDGARASLLPHVVQLAQK